MKKFLPVFVCLSLSVFTVARATKPTHTLDPGTRTLLENANAPEEVASDDDDSAEDASGDEGEDLNDADGSGAVGDEGTGTDDGEDGDGGDDSGSDEEE